MKKLSDLIQNIEVIETKGPLDAVVSGISLDSKVVSADSLFVALIGSKLDGHLFIDQAIQNGARVIVCEKRPDSLVDGVTYIRVSDSHLALGLLASAFYNHPSRKLKLIGVTGTNGKTTVTTLLYHLFRNFGHKVGLIGTIVNKINDISYEAIRTSPDPITINKLLSSMVGDGCEYCFMEVSSHAVSEKRIAGLSFAGGVFTNLTLDHLDYHKTFESYRDAKKEFFDSLSSDAFAISNKDDQNGEYIVGNTHAQKHFYSLKADSDFNEEIKTKLIGEFNQYNVRAVYATAVTLGKESEKAKELIQNLEPVEGRFQYIKSNSGVTAIVDYAHTPDALTNVLETIQKMKGDGKVISVFGCGGDRDRSKRPLMAKIGYDASDTIILTSDNPRTEDPQAILEEMKKGLPSEIPNTEESKIHIISDRHHAIEKAYQLAKSGDYILVAGKGHEKYQEVNGVKTHFDDMEELKNIFKYGR
jgi:UDP-N-acetylmuramoyl-L-alanyl-D-glutamate--2,6-diaminopimelate ligase